MASDSDYVVYFALNTLVSIVGCARHGMCLWYVYIFYVLHLFRKHKDTYHFSTVIDILSCGIIGPFCPMWAMPWASHQICKIAGCACVWNARNVFPPPRVIDPDMHHGTCVTHVPGCMPGSLTRGFHWSRRRENVPGIPGICATRNFTYLVRGPWLLMSWQRKATSGQRTE